MGVYPALTQVIGQSVPDGVVTRLSEETNLASALSHKGSDVGAAAAA